MAVNPRLSTGFRLYSDRDDTHTNPASATYERLDGLVDVEIGHVAPAQDATQQRVAGEAGEGKREYLAGLREKSWTCSFRWDEADATASRTLHSELLADAIAGKKLCYQLDYPAVPGASTPTGALRKQVRAVIERISIPSNLGEVITATLVLRLCGTMTDTTVP